MLQGFIKEAKREIRLIQIYLDKNHKELTEEQIKALHNELGQLYETLKVLEKG